VAYQTKVGAKSVGVIPAHPGNVVHKIMNRRGPAQRALESCRRKDETEVNLVRFRVAILRECSAREAVVETVDDRVAQRPDVAHRESFWMVPRGERRSIWKTLNVIARRAAVRRKVNSTRDGVALIIATSK